MPRGGRGRAAGLLAVLWLTGCAATANRLTMEDLEPEPAGYDWRLPPGFPPPSVPAHNPISPDKVALGRHLFYDERLSRDGNQACASCHRQELAFTDGKARAVGSTGELHPRSSMSLVNVAYNVTLAWADPTLHSLEQQARVPMFNEDPIELGLTGVEEQVLDRLGAETFYREMFAAAFPEDPEPISIDNVARAVASFVRTILAGDAPYNRLVYGGETDAMSQTARRGMRLFFSAELGCSECHAGFTFSGPVDHAFAPPAQPEFHNTGLYNVGGRDRYPEDNTGAFEHTHKRRHRGAFRAPTLYNIALTAPYMHDGSIATLEQVIDFYAAGGRNVTEPPYAGDGRTNRYKSARIRGFSIDESQEHDLLAFLNTLTDPSVLTDPRWSPPTTPAPDTGPPTTPVDP